MTIVLPRRPINIRVIISSTEVTDALQRSYDDRIYSFHETVSHDPCAIYLLITKPTSCVIYPTLRMRDSIHQVRAFFLPLPSNFTMASFIFTQPRREGKKEHILTEE